ncbi:MAG: hypothetical protein V2A74_03440 [bacterium]
MKESQAKRVLLIIAIVLVVVVASILHILSLLARPIEVSKAMQKPPASFERWREEARQHRPLRLSDDSTVGSVSPETERAAQLYVELDKEFQDFNQDKTIYEIFSSPNWRIGRDEPTTRILAFLRDNPAFVSGLQEFARNGILPAREQVLTGEHDPTKPFPDYLFFSYSARLLCANAYLSLDDGDTTRALDSALDCIALSKIIESHYDMFSKLISIGPQIHGVMTLSDLVGRMRLGPDAANDLLDRPDAADLAPKDYPLWFISEYESSRYSLIQIASLPLEELFQDRARPFWYPHDSRSRFDLLGVEIPNPPIVNVLGASLVNPFNPSARHTIRFRNTFSEFLAGYDKWWGEVLEELEKPYPDIRKDIWREDPTFQWRIPLEIPNVEWAFIRGLTAETRYNLLRAALEYGINPASAQAAQNVDFSADRKHRWRDPFTEEPLHVNESEDGPLFYSLGPDLKDQGGKISYDPTNGTVTPGDLILRLGAYPRE